MAEAPRPAAGGWKASIAAGVAGLLIGALAVGAYYAFRAPGRAATEATMRDYILNHGELLPEAMDRARKRQTVAVLQENRAALERPFHSAWAGAADGDVTIVEFFDYACIYCRQSNPHIERLLAEDPRLRLVWREYPVLGPDSERAAIASMEAARSGRFRAFHDSLFATARPTEAAIEAARAASGTGAATLTDEFRRELTSNVELGRAIGADGTPTFVIGNRVLEGAVGYEALKEAIQVARARG